MTIDPGLAALIGTGALALIGVAFGYGMLTNRVKGNRLDINENKQNFRDDMQAFRDENTEGHRLIHEKLDTIIRNGRGG